MYEFLDRLVNIALPRVRDFRGVSPKSFDGRGNYALGLKEQIVFPEIDYDKVDYRARHGHRHLSRPRRPMTRRRALLRASTCRSPTDSRRGGLDPMAKKSSDRKNKKPREVAKQMAGKRARLKAIAGDRTAPRGRPFCGAAQARRAAAQQLDDAHPQPLRADRPSARRLSQIQVVAHRIARARLVRTDPRHGQVELVRETRYVDDRSIGRYADPHPQRRSGPTSPALPHRPRRFARTCWKC